MKETLSYLSVGNVNAFISKYAVIWIWSILIGINSTLTFTFYNSLGSNLGRYTSVFAFIYVIAFLFSLNAWMNLYFILKDAIVPQILYYKNGCEENDKGFFKLKNKPLRISLAFQSIIFAITFKFIGFIFEMVFNSLTF